MRAEKGRAAGLHDPPDRSAAAEHGAGPVFPIIGLEAVLKGAERAVCLAIIAQRGAARLDGLVQHLLDDAGEPERPSRRRPVASNQRAGNARRGESPARCRASQT